jgi:phospholipase C
MTQELRADGRIPWGTNHRRPLALGITVLLVLGGIFATYGVEVRAAPVVPLTFDQELDSHIQHVVILLQENHAYDNYFATYCLVASKVCPHVADGEPAGICVPYSPSNPMRGCVKPYPFNATNLTAYIDMVHTWDSSHTAWNNGSMNGFIQAEGTIESLGYYNQSTVPVYWDIAQEFGLGDQFFSSKLDYSLPNHWFLVANDTPAEALKNAFVYKTPGTKANATEVADRATYLAQANATPSAEDLLAANPNVTWKWYDTPLFSNYSRAIQQNGDEPGAFGYWNPQAAKAESYTPKFDPHFVARSTFFQNAANGTLPNVSWIMPAFNESDHPKANITQGQNWVASLVNAVESGPEWNSTAFFISWDEYGGYYDHVAPPAVTGGNLGFRVPLLVVSPWTPKGYVGNKVMSFSSLLHLVEVRWNLGCFGTNDCQAAIPTGFFDWSIHRAPVYFSPWAQAVYPYVPPPKPRGGPIVPYINESLAANSVNTTTNAVQPDID